MNSERPRSAGGQPDREGPERETRASCPRELRELRELREPAGTGRRDQPSGDSVELCCGDWESLAEAARPVRVEVFVHEQGVPLELEWDEMDAVSTHCVAFAGDRAVATGRLLPDGHIGRMAVLAPWRGTGLGGRMLERLVELARERGHREVRLHAQQQAEGFYLAHGFEPEGEPFDEAGIPHVAMRRALG